MKTALILIALILSTWHVAAGVVLEWDPPDDIQLFPGQQFSTTLLLVTTLPGVAGIDYKFPTSPFTLTGRITGITAFEDLTKTDDEVLAGGDAGATLAAGVAQPLPPGRYPLGVFTFTAPASAGLYALVTQPISSEAGYTTMPDFQDHPFDGMAFKRVTVVPEPKECISFVALVMIYAGFSRKRYDD